MEKMEVCIVDLREYGPREKIGGWFSCPVNMEAVKERLGLGDNHGEYGIYDYNLPFKIDEYITLEELNRLCQMVIELEPHMQDDLEELLACGYRLEELYDKKDDITFYPGYDSMEDLAYYLVDDCGILGEIPDKVRLYFDYEAYGRDLEINGTFVVGKHGIYQLN